MTAIPKFLCATVAGALAAAAHVAAASGITITEVDPYGSNSASGYNGNGNEGDWFVLTNTGSTAVNITGWTMVDNHASSNSASSYDSGNDAGNPYYSGTISLGNVSSKKPPAPLTIAGDPSDLIGAGQSVVFLESVGDASSSSALIQAFETAWFGSPGNAPAGLLVGTYDDSSADNFGLSTSSDMVNIFNGSASDSALVASVAFNADGGSPVSTFDNSAGLNDALLTKLSTAGVDGAVVSANGAEVGTPYFPEVAPVPLPDSLGLLFSGTGVLGFMLRRRRSAAA
ncbi:MAG TPA: lamin tail domain-containing protein [Steroidobacteraceae bacterium]|nr:lamin tail domain-containing protein [Steroidobacteraceae bacterium]